MGTQHNDSSFHPSQPTLVRTSVPPLVCSPVSRRAPGPLPTPLNHPRLLPESNQLSGPALYRLVICVLCGGEVAHQRNQLLNGWNHRHQPRFESPVPTMTVVGTVLVSLPRLCISVPGLSF